MILPFSNYFYLNSLECAIYYLLGRCPGISSPETRGHTSDSIPRRVVLHSYIAERTDYQKATSSTSFHYAETLLHPHPSSSHISSCCINRWSSPCLRATMSTCALYPMTHLPGTLFCWLSILSRIHVQYTLDSPSFWQTRLLKSVPSLKPLSTPTS